MDENVYYVAFDADAARAQGVAVPEEEEDIDTFRDASSGKLEVCEGPDFGECVDEVTRASAHRRMGAIGPHGGAALGVNVGIATVDADTHDVLFYAEEPHTAYRQTFVLITTDPDLGPLHNDYVCEAEPPYRLLRRVGDFDLY